MLTTMRRNVYSTCDSQLPNGSKYVSVNLLTFETLYFVVNVKSKVNELFNQICKFLNLLEPELFGLSINTDGSGYIFLDSSQKLCKYACKQWKQMNNGVDSRGNSLFSVYFRVQFYVDSYLFISDKVAKLLYYLQLRENVVNYGQALCEERAFLLASYALQADFGSFNPEIHVGQYFNPHHYFPSWVIEQMGVDYIIRHSPFLHRDHKRMHKSEAQSMFIKEASDASAPHNLHFYHLNNKKATSEVWLGICTNGIEINTEHERLNCTQTGAKQKTRISLFTWPDIGKLYFEKKKFEICSTGYPIRKFTYYANSEEMARHLLYLCRTTHQFQLVVHSKMQEVKKREFELSRKKFRESYIYSDTFELPIIGRNKKGSISHTNISLSDENVAQRISVISNVSSNSTSGIVSDKVQSLDDSDRDDIDIDLMINGPPNVLTAKSLNLSEPSIDANASSASYSPVLTMPAKVQTDSKVPSYANSIKSTSSLQSNTAFPLISHANKPLSIKNQVIHILNNNNNNNNNIYNNSSRDYYDVKNCLPLNDSTFTSLINEECLSNSFTKVQQFHDESVRSNHISKLTERSESMNHIYENIPYFSHYHKLESKPKQILKACPSLNSAVTTAAPTHPTATQRSTTRIGVSSLTRTHNKPTLSVFNNKCVGNNKCTNLSIAGSEPNLYNSKLWSSAASNYVLQSPHHCLNLPLNCDINKCDRTPNAIDCLSSSDSISVSQSNWRMNSGAKEARTQSDPVYNYTSPTIAMNNHCNGQQQQQQPSPTSLTKRSAHLFHEYTPTSFHQSLNDIAITPINATSLRLVGSEVNVNLNYNSQPIPPPPDYANSLSNISTFKPSHKQSSPVIKNNMNGIVNSKNLLNEQSDSISDLHQLRQKSRDLNLPLITALFNDRSLMMLPKTVPCSRQRHTSTSRDFRRFSCASDIYPDSDGRHILSVPLTKFSETDLLLLNNRPTSWHSEYPNINHHSDHWEPIIGNRQLTQQNQQNKFYNATADFIDRLWAENQLTTRM